MAAPWKRNTPMDLRFRIGVSTNFSTEPATVFGVRQQPGCGIQFYKATFTICLPLLPAMLPGFPCLCLLGFLLVGSQQFLNRRLDLFLDFLLGGFLDGGQTERFDDLFKN